MINIIGGGPVGSNLAYLLAKKGLDVRVIEEHKKIGEPVKCTGITTTRLSKIIDVDKSFVLNRLKKVKVYSKNNKVELKVDEFVLDRVKLDKYLYKKAEKAGAEFLLGHTFVKSNKDRIFIKSGSKKKEFNRDVLVGADGPLSKIYDFLNKKKLNYFYGIQAVVDLDVERDCFETYFGSLCPGFFAWVVPEKKGMARVGLAMRTDPRRYFDKFLINRVGKDYKKRVIEYQSGLIPIYDRNVNVSRNNFYLVGDAASQVKATTGGGLVPGLTASRILAESLIKKTSYKEGLRGLNKELMIGLLIRKILSRFSDKDYDKLLQLMNDKDVRDLLYKHDRDEPSKILLRLLLMKPHLIKFAKVL